MPNAIQDPLDRLSSIIEGEKSPFVELSERMRTTSKDVQNLNLSILDLAIALEKRAGVNKEKDTKKEDKKVEQARTLSSDTKDFFKGFKDYFKENKDYILSKSSLPADVEKLKPEISVAEPNMVSDDMLKRENTVIEDNKEPVEIAKGSSEDQSKVLSDMVEVLIDMRDDKSQKQLVEEAAAIKKLIVEQNKKTELPGGIEPNNEEAKDLEREKLSDLIAKKLGEVMQDLGIGSSIGVPGMAVPGKGGPPAPIPGKGGKPPPSGPSKLKTLGSLGGRLLGAAGLAYSAYEASEFLDEIGYGDKMKEGAGKDAEKAFKENVAPTIDPNKADVTKEQALAALENGSPRDIEKLGGAEALRKIAGIEPTKPFEQASLRQYDYKPDTSPKIPEVEPKPNETSVGKILNEVSDQNTELKMFNMNQSEAGAVLAPIISNKTINNTEQTLISSSPIPHSNANSFNRWQSKRTAYTD